MTVTFSGGALRESKTARPEQATTAARTAHLDVGWVAVASSYGVVSDAAELGAEGAVGGTAQFGLPHERCLRHSPRSGQSSAPPLRGATASLRLGFQPAIQQRHHRHSQGDYDSNFQHN